jgi:hypothetical protein
MFGETPTCPPEQYYNPLTGQCELVIDQDKIHPCPQGQHTDPVTYNCKPNDDTTAPVKASMGPIGWSLLVGATLVSLGAIAKRLRPAQGRRRR